MTERYEYGDERAPVVLLQPVDAHDLETIGGEVAAIRALTAADFRLIAFPVGDWNRDLSPWEAPAVFGKDGFGGGAPETLGRILKSCEDGTKTYYLGGYSLAGLFALWAAYRTDRFRGVAAASPSVWFPGFTEFMKDREIGSGRVYLSLGNKEEKARSPLLASVGDRIREAYGLLRERRVDCVLEWNEGNHFREPELRTAKAFAWLMNGNGADT